LLHSVLHGDAPASTGQLFDASFEFSERRIRPADFATDDGKSQEAGLIDFGNLAFGLLIATDIEPFHIHRNRAT